MVEFINYVKAFGIMFFIGALLMAGGYWMIVIFKKKFPNFKFWFKYSVLKRKHDEEEIMQLIQYLDAKMTVEDVKKLLLLKGNTLLKKVEDLCYVYDQMIQKEVKKYE